MNADELTIRLDQHGKSLDRIEAKVDKTNGRVTTIELWRARVTGAWFVVSLAGPAITVLVVKALT